MCSSKKSAPPPPPPPKPEPVPEPEPVVNPGGKPARDLIDGTPPDPVEFARQKAKLDDEPATSLVGSLGSA
jgi:hypothetical protein